ncbi:hypothetical protein [Microlunatus ginsengisoli]|uniref:Transposase n=1 Tax=Microlunatus ginsengisoli TaxID=363863 RepID=A0ABP7A2I0_9ACTN
MTDHPRQDRGVRGTPDLPLILEQLQDQLDDLRLAVEAQQGLIALLTSRITSLEQARGRQPSDPGSDDDA